MRRTNDEKQKCKKEKGQRKEKGRNIIKKEKAKKEN